MRSTATSTTGYKLGYARVPTLQPDEALQARRTAPGRLRPDLSDKASGKLESRPALDELLAQARPGRPQCGGQPPNRRRRRSRVGRAEEARSRLRRSGELCSQHDKLAVDSPTPDLSQSEPVHPGPSSRVSVTRF